MMNSAGKGNSKLTHGTVERFTLSKIPAEIEDDILNVYAQFSIDHDMSVKDLPGYFEALELPQDLVKLIRKEDLVIDGTDIIDFDKIIRQTYELLIFINNEELIDEFWTLLLQNCGRLEQFPRVKLKDHILGTKDLQKISNVVNNNSDTDASNSSADVLDMLIVATNGKRVFITYLDFAIILGKLGYLLF